MMTSAYQITNEWINVRKNLENWISTIHCAEYLRLLFLNIATPRVSVEAAGKRFARTTKPFFNSSGTFQVAQGVTSVRVLLVGGGGSGMHDSMAEVQAVTLRAARSMWAVGRPLRWLSVPVALLMVYAGTVCRFLVFLHTRNQSLAINWQLVFFGHFYLYAGGTSSFGTLLQASGGSARHRLQRQCSCRRKWRIGWRSRCILQRTLTNDWSDSTVQYTVFICSDR